MSTIIIFTLSSSHPRIPSISRFINSFISLGGDVGGARKPRFNLKLIALLRKASVRKYPLDLHYFPPPK
jgi:hypothetical protein